MATSSVDGVPTTRITGSRNHRCESDSRQGSLSVPYTWLILICNPVAPTAPLDLAPGLLRLWRPDERLRLSLSGSRLRHRRNQRAVLARSRTRMAAGAGRPSHHQQLSRPARGDRGGRAEARPAAALGHRLRGRAGRRADAQAHQRALGDGRPRDRAPRRPRAGPAAQRLRGAGPVPAGDPEGLGPPDRRASLRGPGPAGDPGAGNRPRRRRADRNRGPATPRSRRRPATSISGRFGRRNSTSGPISSGRTAA